MLSPSKHRVGFFTGLLANQSRNGYRRALQPIVLCALSAVLIASLTGCPKRSASLAADPVGSAVARLLTSVAADSSDTDAAVAAIAALGDAAIPHLTQALQDPNEDVRLAAVSALGQLKSPETVSPLIAALNDDSWNVRQAAVEALGAKRDRRAVQPLLAQFAKDDDAQVRYECLNSLGQIGDPAAVDVLVKGTADDDPYVRMWAMSALCDMQDSHAPALARSLVSDPNPYVVRKVLQSCARAFNTPEGHEVLTEAALSHPDFEATVWARRYLVSFVESGAYPELAGSLRTASRNALAGDHGANAALLLGYLGDPQAVEPLMAALSNPNALVRHHAAYCLGIIGDRRAVPALLRTLRDPNALVVLAAYSSLQRFAAAGDPRAQAALRKSPGKNERRR